MSKKLETDRKYREANRERLNAYNKEWRKNHREACRRAGLKCYYKNHEEAKARSRDWHHRNPDKSLALKLRKYGLTLMQYDELVLNQGGVCAICEKENDPKDHLLSVDHCHVTGKVRGLLCKKCNTGIGQFNDSSALLARAIFFLRGEKIAPC